MSAKVESDYDTGWREGYEAASGQAGLAHDLIAEIKRLRAALEKHHELLSDEPGDVCLTCALDCHGRDKNY